MDDLCLEIGFRGKSWKYAKTQNHNSDRQQQNAQGI